MRASLVVPRRPSPKEATLIRRLRTLGVDEEFLRRFREPRSREEVAEAVRHVERWHGGEARQVVTTLVGYVMLRCRGLWDE